MDIFYLLVLTCGVNISSISHVRLRIICLRELIKVLDAMRKQIQSLVDYVWNHRFWTYAMLRTSLTMIIRINYFRSPFWFALILMRNMTLYNLLLLPSSSFFALQLIWGLWFQQPLIFDL